MEQKKVLKHLQDFIHCTEIRYGYSRVAEKVSTNANHLNKADNMSQRLHDETAGMVICSEQV